MSNSLQPYGLQHARLPCPSVYPGVCSNSCPLSWWCNHCILCHPLLLPPSVFPKIRVFSSELAVCIRRPKYWSFSFSISPSNEYTGLISFRIDWCDLPVSQFESISFLQLGPVLISIYDYWKKHNSDYTDHMVTTARKLKDSYSLEGKLWPI